MHQAHAPSENNWPRPHATTTTAPGCYLASPYPVTRRRHRRKVRAGADGVERRVGGSFRGLPTLASEHGQSLHERHSPARWHIYLGQTLAQPTTSLPHHSPNTAARPDHKARSERDRIERRVPVRNSIPRRIDTTSPPAGIRHRLPQKITYRSPLTQGHDHLFGPKHQARCSPAQQSVDQVHGLLHYLPERLLGGHVLVPRAC